MKLFLIGFMGSGKSTVGQVLAQSLGYTFVDLDELIENQTGRTITKLFSELGEAKYRDLEYETLTPLLLQDRILIATGGGTPCHHDIMSLLLQTGKVIFLDVPAEDLIRRLHLAREGRPLLSQLPEQELPSFIRSKLDDRMPVYQRAHLHYRWNGENPETTIAFIRAWVVNQNQQAG